MTFKATRWGDDMELLHMLDRFHNDGASANQLAREFTARSGIPTSRNSILSIVKRVRDVTEPSEHDRTMPRRWWDQPNRRS